MTKVSYEYIEEYLRAMIPVGSVLQQEMRTYAEENHIPIVEEETEELIRFLLMTARPRKILELGTAIGYSAISFCKTVPEIEKMDTVEIRPDMANLARENIAKAGLEDKIHVHVDDAYHFLTQCQEHYDIIFIDAAKGQYEKYFEESLKNLKPHGMIICDNVLFRGMIANQELVVRRKITIVKRLRKFLPKIMADENFITSIVPIGDGVLLIRRNDEKKN